MSKSLGGFCRSWKPSSSDTPEDMLNAKSDWYGSESSYDEFLGSIVRKYRQAIWESSLCPAREDAC